MSTVTPIEDRMAAVEAAVADLQRRVPRPAGSWLDQVTGSFKDEPAFDEVLAYGRAASRPRAQDGEAFGRS